MRLHDDLRPSASTQAAPDRRVTLRRCTSRIARRFCRQRAIQTGGTSERRARAIERKFSTRDARYCFEHNTLFPASLPRPRITNGHTVGACAETAGRVGHGRTWWLEVPGRRPRSGLAPDVGFRRVRIAEPMRPRRDGPRRRPVSPTAQLRAAMVRVGPVNARFLADQDVLARHEHVDVTTLYEFSVDPQPLGTSRLANHSRRRFLTRCSGGR
jgi:hypothetical protein